MRVAVFHNFLDNIGGAEIVTLTLARELNGDIYTTNIDKEKITKMGFADVLPQIHSIGRIPKNAPWRHQLAFWKFRRLNLGRRYDFYIIAGDWAMSGAVNNGPNLWYAHSPLNELWEFKDHIRNDILPFWKRPLFDAWVWFNRRLTLKYAKHINKFACNSSNTKERLKKYYGVKDAAVIYPPINVGKYRCEADGGYWLSVNRLAEHKRVGVQLEAFSRLPNERLVIVGSYEAGASQFEVERRALLSVKPENIEILSWVTDEKLVDLYARAKGFITTSMNEDFGMTVVEAMASGKPVISPNEGGYKETIVSGQNGMLIDDIDSDKLAEAVKNLSAELAENPERYKDACIAQAKKIDAEVFIRKIKENIIYR